MRMACAEDSASVNLRSANLRNYELKEFERKRKRKQKRNRGSDLRRAQSGAKPHSPPRRFPRFRFCFRFRFNLRLIYTRVPSCKMHEDETTRKNNQKEIPAWNVRKNRFERNGKLELPARSARTKPPEDTAMRKKCQNEATRRVECTKRPTKTKPVKTPTWGTLRAPLAGSPLVLSFRVSQDVPRASPERSRASPKRPKSVPRASPECLQSLLFGSDSVQRMTST